jgi:Fe-S-cluster-containing hydrogenase component 2
MTDAVPQINAENCMGCGLCTVACPDNAMTLKEIRTEDFVPE